MHLPQFIINQVLARRLSVQKRAGCVSRPFQDLLRFSHLYQHIYVDTCHFLAAGRSGQLEVRTNDSLIPVLTISPFYSRMLKEHNDIEVHNYLTEKIHQAQWMIHAISQRRSAMTACAQCILELQKTFFHGNGHLKPMVLADVAQRVGIHESTVNRTTNGKYLQCVKGTYPLSYFFSRSLRIGNGDGAPSSNQAKALLRQLIAREDERKPLSDQKLCEYMAEQGCSISRRTVAKYREELGIPGAAGRK